MDIAKNFTDIETKFNLAGSIPFLGIVSGIVRIIAGKVQLIASAVIGIIALIAMVFNPESKKLEDISHKAFENVIHGGLNMLRGFGEFILGFTFVGSFILLTAQSISNNRFAPIYKYREPEPPSELKSILVL